MTSSKGGIDQFILYRYRYGIGMVALLFVTVFALVFKLHDLVPGISDVEAAQGLSSISMRDVFDNPIFAPYKVLQWVSIKALGTTTLALRIPSTLFGAASVFLLYDVFRHWHKQRIAIVGSLFFVTSSWFLHSARLGVPSITLPFFVLVLLWAGTKLHHAPLRKWPFLIMAFVVALSLYIPYMVYFLIAGVALHRFAVKKYLWHLSIKTRILGLACLFIVISPLVYAFVREPDLVRMYFGIPESLPTITNYLKNINDTVGYIFWRSVANPVYHLGTLPMLDIFSATMTALGVYQYEKQLNQHRTKWLFIGSFILVITLALAARVDSFTALLPLVYIFAATGIVTLLVQWYEIFPKNPVARTIGLIPIIVLLVIVSGYHGNRYFIAWAKSPETLDQFNQDTVALRESILAANQHNKVVVVAPESEHLTLEFSLRGTAKSVVLFTTEEFKGSKITADVIYVHREAKLPKATTKQLKKTGEVLASRSINPLAYKIYAGTDAKIKG